MPRITDLRLRRGTAASWTSSNPTLGDGEPGLETDTYKVKWGNGTAPWASLPYFITDWIISRGTDLVSNGTGLLGNNTNFSQFTYNTEAPAGAAGAFDTSATVPGSLNAFNDEDIPVDTARRYLFRFMARQRNANVPASRLYAGISPRDKQAQTIMPHMYSYTAASSTTLATALNPGDTVINLTSSAGWTTSTIPGDEYMRYVGIWNWADPTGKVWPASTYTRNTPIYNSISGNTLTLKSAYAGPAMPSGTPLANTRAGGNYLYLPTAGNVVMPLTWTAFSGSLGGLHDGSTGTATTKFPPGTAFVRLVWLPNYLTSTIPGGETSTQSFASISFSDSTQALQEAAQAQTDATAALSGLAGKANTVHTHAYTDFGVLPDLGANKDLNTYLTTGEWNQDQNVNATTLLNYPLAQAGHFRVRANANFVYQYYTTYGSGTRQFWRAKYTTNAFSVWKEIPEAVLKQDLIAAGTTAQYWRGDKTWQPLDKNAVGLGSVDNTSDAAKPVSTAAQAALDAKAPTASPTFTGTVSGVTKAHVGLGSVDNTADTAKPISTAALAALALKQDIDGSVIGTPGRQFRLIGCVVRNTGSGFDFISDSSHYPSGVSSITTSGDGLSFTINYSFTASSVVTLTATPDETLAKKGYVMGGSVGLSSATFQVGQPGGFYDYVSWNGSAWTSFNGYVTSTSMNGTTGLITCTHQDMSDPIGGSVVSRSLTKRASMEGLGGTTTTLYLVDNAGVTVKTPTTDNRFWISRGGSRAVPMSELVYANSNIWIQGLMIL